MGVSPPRTLLLAVNAGSSSLKISLFERTPSTPTLLVTASIRSLSSPPARFSLTPAALSAPSTSDVPVPSIVDHASAFAHFLDVLSRDTHAGIERVRFICHRVVHGGDHADPIVITAESYEHITKLSDLAPLHNGAALSVMRVCLSTLPSATSIAYFDTAFHRSIPAHVASYAIDPAIAAQRGLKKYGFHGLSYAFTLRAVAQFLNKTPRSLNLIILHLGSGASACAVKNGASLDTTMGLTPLSGLPGATRSGAVDPSLIFHYTNRAGRITHDPELATALGVTNAEDILNRHAGWKALTGTTEFGDFTERAKLTWPYAPAAAPPQTGATDESVARLAFDLFLDRLLTYIGSYHLKLGGCVDAIVFAGGIGERSVELRRAVGEAIACIGFTIDITRNAGTSPKGASVWDIGVKENNAKRMLVCQTDEQMEMARECALDQERWIEEN